MIRRLAIVTLILVFTAGGILAQDATPTPAVINLSAAAPVAPAVESAIATPTRTPAPPSGALLEAKEIANVREGCDLVEATLDLLAGKSENGPVQKHIFAA